MLCKLRYNMTYGKLLKHQKQQSRYLLRYRLFVLSTYIGKFFKSVLHFINQIDRLPVIIFGNIPDVIKHFIKAYRKCFLDTISKIWIIFGSFGNILPERSAGVVKLFCGQVLQKRLN